MIRPVTPISVVIPVKDGGRLFGHLRAHLRELRDRLAVEVLVLDSGSTDGSPEAAESDGFRVDRIEPEAFGHGRTRARGLRLARGEVVCFLTQDVLPCTPDWPLVFRNALADPTVAGVYGRQVPRDAAPMEMFFVQLNYPEERLRFDPRPGGHTPRPGRVLFSNAFSAVRRATALEVGYPEDAEFSEDQIFAHKALAAGYSIAYEPGAEALHAHVYTLEGLFRRNRSVGRALKEVGIDGGATFPESIRFLAEELRYFVHQGHAHRLPQLLPYEFIRWMGFQVGRLAPTVPDEEAPDDGAADSGAAHGEHRATRYES